MLTLYLVNSFHVYHNFSYLSGPKWAFPILFASTPWVFIGLPDDDVFLSFLVGTVKYRRKLQRNELCRQESERLAIQQAQEKERHRLKQAQERERQRELEHQEYLIEREHQIKIARDEKVKELRQCREREAERQRLRFLPDKGRVDWIGDWVDSEDAQVFLTIAQAARDVRSSASAITQQVRKARV